MANLLTEGKHEVIIEELIKTKTKNNLPCIKIIYRNSYGYIPHIIVLNKNTEIIFKIIFNRVGLDYDVNGKHDLINKKVIIDVKKTLFKDVNGFERKYLSVNKCYPIHYYFSDLIVDDFYDDDTTCLFEIFGTSREDVAEDMGKDPSEVTDDDVYVWAGH